MKRKKLTLPRIFSLPTNTNRHGIYPFTQQPPENIYPTEPRPSNRHDGPTELFARFTAEIIKKEVVFER